MGQAGTRWSTDVDDAAQESGGPFSSLGFHALPLGRGFWVDFSTLLVYPGRWRMRETH